MNNYTKCSALWTQIINIQRSSHTIIVQSYYKDKLIKFTNKMKLQLTQCI